MASVSPLRHSSPDSSVHTQLQHPLNQPRAPQRSPVDARSSQYPPVNSQRSPSRDASAHATYNAARQQPLPRNFPAPPINSHLSKSAADNAALDAATAAIARAGSSLDVGDTSLLNDLCERLSNPDLYTRPITRQRIIELLEIASEEIAKTRAAGLWEITARVAQERHFVCPPQMEGTVKSYIKMVDTVNENLGSFDEDDLKARLAKINQSKPFQANIPANTACLFCRRRKIKCDGSLPQCDMCTKHRQAKCEYPQKSHYGGFSNRGGLHYVVPMGPDIAAAAASAVPGASPPVHLDPGKPVKGYAPPAPTAAPTFILPGPPPSGSTTSSSMYGGSQRTSDAPASARHEPAPRHGSYTPSTGASSHYDPVRQGPGNYGSQSHQVNYKPRHDGGDSAVPEGHREKGWDDGFADEEDDDTRPASSTSSQILQNRHAAHLARNGNQDVEMEDGEGVNEVPRRRSPHTGHERCINCDTDKTSLWRKDEDGRTICNACQIYFRVHGRKRPPSMRSSTVKKRPGRQPRPSTGPLPLPGQELYIHRIDDESFASERQHPDSAQHVLRPKNSMAHPPANNQSGRSPVSSGSRSPPSHGRRHSPPPAEYVQHQQQQLRVIEQAIANGQRTQPARTAGLDYALGGSRSGPPRTQNSEGYRGRAADYVSGQDRQISPEARNSYNRDARPQHHHSLSADASIVDAMSEDRHRRESHLSRRVSDEHRGEHSRRDAPAEPDEETEVQAGENLCAVEGGRSPADVLVFRFDADRAKSVCATQWAHLRSPNRSVEDDLRFHLNCYRKNPPEPSSSDRVTLGVATDWLPKAGVYSITSGDEPPSAHHMAPPPHGKLNQTIDITSDIREGLNTLKFTQLRDMSDCVLVVQIWKVGRKGAGAPPRGASSQATHSHYSGMSPPGPIPDKHHTRASHSTRGPPVYEAAPSPDLPPYNTTPPGRTSKSRNSDKSNGTATPVGSRRSCLYCYNNHIACRPSHQENLGCEECLRRGIQCAMPEEYSPDIGYHNSVDRKPMVNPALRSPPSHMSTQGTPAHMHTQSAQSTPLSPGSVSGKRKPEEQLPPPPAPGSAATARSKRPYKRKSGTESTPPPTHQQALPPMHHIQHVPPPPAQSGYAAALGTSNGNRLASSVADSRANQDLRRHQEMLIKQQQDAERENARVLAGGLPTPYA
ncbi:hypothetical protein FRC07_005220 [Ceratobasidium sp. 392]|nr:hypothetical protein FRC07_005220 [Ceratobasidium sp. 392]